jgi:membrane-bound lytic murein transglycosylase D
MRNGETLAQVAAKFGLEQEALRAVNGIGAKAKVPAGHTLLVPTQGPSEAAGVTLAQAVFTTVPQGRTFYYKVKRGDTIAGIATRYGVSPTDLKRWNSLAQNNLAAGQTLRITSDLAPSTGNAKRTAGNRPKSATARARPQNVKAAPAGKARPVAKAAPAGKAPPVAKAGVAAGS